MGDPLDYLTASGTINDEADVNLATQLQQSSDDISQAFIAKEVATAMSAAAAADEIRRSAAFTQNTSRAQPPPTDAQDVHILQTIPNLRTKRRVIADDSATDHGGRGGQESYQIPPYGYEHDSSPRAAVDAEQGPGAASSSKLGSSHDRPDLQRFEFPSLEDAATSSSNTSCIAVQSESSKGGQPSIMKLRKANLRALTLPDQGDEQISHQSSPGARSPISPTVLYRGFMTSRKPPKVHSRLKARLQDPPPMQPVVLRLVNDRRDSRTRRYSLPEHNNPEPTFGGLHTSRRPKPGGLSRVASFVAAATPSKIKSIANMLFSPRTAGAAAPSGSAPPEEEVDPLEDESIPQYKRWKRKSNKWLYWMQRISLIALIALLVCSVRYESLRKVYWYNLVLWQWLTLMLMVSCGRLIAGGAVQLLVVLIEHHYLLKRQVLYFVYGLRHAVKNCIWLTLVIGTWKIIFRNNTDTQTIPVITKVLWCFFAASLLWMAKVLFVKVAANSFHRAAYFDRIQDCLFHQYVLETISQPKYVEGENESTWLYGGVSNEQDMRTPQLPGTPREMSLRPVTSDLESQVPKSTGIAYETQPSDPRPRTPHGWQGLSTSKYDAQQPPSAHQTPDRKVSYVSIPGTTNGKVTTTPEVVIAQDKLQGLTSHTVSAWTLRRLMKLVRTHNMTTYASMLSDDWEIDSEAQAKAAAKQIFYNMADRTEKSLTLKNFLEFFPEEKAPQAFELFELSDQGTISKKALVKWVVTVYKERKALSLTLSDNRTVVAKLHRVLDVLVLAVLLTICFLIMGVNTQKLLVAFSSILLPSVFVFGNAARSTFESLIFLFIMHPFDVGDRILVDGNSLVVEELNILNTIFLSGSNEKVYYPNSVLASKPISNFYRSPDQWDTIDFQIHASTPVEKIGILKEKMTKYIESLPQFWYPTFRVLCKDIEDSNRMKMSIWMQHHLNFQEAGERWQRRSNMILHMKTVLEELKIGFQLPRQEITVTGIPLLDVPHTFS
ncbi:unnamed protein product [Sphagnum tenellum]